MWTRTTGAAELWRQAGAWLGEHPVEDAPLLAEVAHLLATDRDRGARVRLVERRVRRRGWGVRPGTAAQPAPDTDASCRSERSGAVARRQRGRRGRAGRAR